MPIIISFNFLRRVIPAEWANTQHGVIRIRQNPWPGENRVKFVFDLFGTHTILQGVQGKLPCLPCGCIRYTVYLPVSSFTVDCSLTLGAGLWDE